MTAAAAAVQWQIGLGLSPLMARLLAARGWRETAAVTEFLLPRLEQTHSPWLMLGMEAAVGRIRAGIERGEHIRILGDYDADGTIATVILRQALTTLGAHVSFELPQRLEAGYGLQLATVERAAGDGVALAITVDTGIREIAALQRARELGLDVIVTDHHLPGPEAPPAYVVLNPHQAQCRYPDKGLCGAGVAFKLAHALLERSGKLQGEWPPALRSYLKLVALGTIADAVPLLGENRVLARFGLEGLTNPVNPGLRALLAMAMPAGRATTSRDVGFRIAPRLNAAGRMGRADIVVELFFCDPPRAQALAQQLEALNLERQRVCETICAAISARLAAEPGLADRDLLLLAGDGWHRGVLGIVASRVMSQTGKPVVIVSRENGVAHGSGRAPEGFHLLRALETCRPLLARYGGHAQAVGFQLPTERLADLETGLLAASASPARTLTRCEEGFEVQLPELTLGFGRELERLQPFGEGNPEPAFVARGVRVAAAPAVLKEKHLKLELEQDGARLTALYWNRWREGERAELGELRRGAILDVSFRLERSAHPQFGERMQLILRELRPIDGY